MMKSSGIKRRERIKIDACIRKPVVHWLGYLLYQRYYFSNRKTHRKVMLTRELRESLETEKDRQTDKKQNKERKITDMYKTLKDG